MEGVTEKNPFGKFARRFDSILVFYVLDHMFCLVDMDDFRSVTVKSTPVEIEELKMNRESVSRHSNMSEKYWIQINLGGDVSDREIYLLLKSHTTSSKPNTRKKADLMNPGATYSLDSTLITCALHN